MSEKYYPPVGFYFTLSISGEIEESKVSFKEVSGISMEMGPEEIADGGENPYIHRIPTSVKYSNLVLKRGLMSKDSAIFKWCREILNGGIINSIETKSIVVRLLGEKGDPLISWQFVNAWPVTWTLADLGSTHTEILIETVEFAYSHFEKFGK